VPFSFGKGEFGSLRMAVQDVVGVLTYPSDRCVCCRQQRSKKTAEVEKKLRDALGMEDEGEHDSEEKAGRENTQREVV
jgi:hypothetical protein